MLLKKSKVKFSIFNLFVGFVILNLIFSCNRFDKNKIRIEPLYIYDGIDTLNYDGIIRITKTNRYVIHGFVRSKEMRQYSDSFVEKNKKNYPYTFDSFFMIFYKYSDITNNEYLKVNRRDLDRYSQNNDVVYSYEFRDGKLSFYEYKKGIVINPSSQIEVE